MGHFAKVINGIVEQVIVAEQDFINTLVDKDAWIQTSYNTRKGVHWNQQTNQPSEDQTKALRKNYAGIVYTYDAQRDAFIPPKPYASWVLNEQTCVWDSPVPYPIDDKKYIWDEITISWVEATNGN